VRSSHLARTRPAGCGTGEQLSDCDGRWPSIAPGDRRAVLTCVKDRHNFGHYSFVGLGKVGMRCAASCTTHNQMKLIRAQPAPLFG
jgi:hypothetical protein